MIAVKFYQFIYSFINKRKLISNNNKRQFFKNKKISQDKINKWLQKQLALSASPNFQRYFWQVAFFFYSSIVKGNKETQKHKSNSV